jgi:L-lactate dehydrogenase complex protein LldG
MGTGKGARELAEQFAAELQALSGTFLAISAAEVPALVTRLARERRAERLLAWDGAQLPVPGLLEALRAAGLRVDTGLVSAGEGRAARLNDLETISLGLTGVDAAIAETGSLVLLAGPGRPRLAAMSVRTHLALFTPEQLHPTLAAWLAGRPELAADLRARSAAVFITGPSRTGDIEMTLTVGVHGPGEVIAVLLQP